MGRGIIRYFKRNKISALLVALQLVGLTLVTAMGLRVFQFGTKAYTILTAPPTDTCNTIQVTASEPSSCPRITSGQNRISDYTAIYTLKNITGVGHTVNITKRSDYCTQPFGMTQPGIGDPGCWANTINSDQQIYLGPNQSVDIPIERSSLSGQACGSFQTDLLINSVDGRTSCHSQNGVGAANAASVCQTGISCETSTPSPTPTVTPTPTPTATPTVTPTPTPTPTNPPSGGGGGGNPGAPPGCIPSGPIVWAPTFTLWQRDSQDSHTLHLQWTTVRDGLHTYWLEWGTDGVNWPWQEVVQGESVDLHNIPSSSVWARVAGYDCTIGPFSAPLPQVLGATTQLPSTGAPLVALLFVAVATSGSGFYLFKRFRI